MSFLLVLVHSVKTDNFDWVIYFSGVELEELLVYF